MSRKGQRAHNRVNIDDAKLRELYIDGQKSATWAARVMRVPLGSVYRRLRELKLTRTNSESHKGCRPSNFKGRYQEGRNGYIMIRIEMDHPFAVMGIKPKEGNGLYVREHRLVMAKHLGRPLERWEIVHHKNHDKADNRLENLELIQSQTEHQGETIMHASVLNLKRENEAMKRIIADCPLCRAALKALEEDGSCRT